MTMRTKTNPSRRAKADPICALIAKHLEAIKTYLAVVRVESRLRADDPRYRAADKASRAAANRADKLLLKVLTARPKSLTGVVALLAHIGQWEFLKKSKSAFDETLLSSANSLTHGKLKRAAQEFPLHLAATLRGLIAQTRS
jgi:hypothetical protein